MNERIKELASEAMVERASGFREFDANVFAELLIRECAYIPISMWDEAEHAKKETSQKV